METQQTQCITITNDVILSFYRENPHLDFVTMNLVFIDILKNLSSNLSSTINSTINSKILSIVSDIDKNISLMKSDILLKFLETKKDYMEDLKSILHTNIVTNNEKLTLGIERSNELLISRVTTLIKDVIPKSHETSYAQIESCIKGVVANISRDTATLIDLTNKLATSGKDDTIMRNFIESIDTHLTQMFSTIQQPIFSSIHSSEERTNAGIQQIKENFIQHQNIQETLRNEMLDFLNKYKNSPQFKGNVAEIELQHMLLSIMPSDEVIRVSSDTATCDFRVNRKDPKKPSILFENKYYKNRSATTDEVKKFERDVQLQKIHGVFISQESPITYKDNFQIDIINGLIHVYIPNANYEAEKLKIAVDIIDNLSLRLADLIKDNDEYSISKEDIDDLAEDFKSFGIQKIQMLDTIKSVNKQLTDKLEDIQLPRFKKFLMKMGNIENDNNHQCPYCVTWLGKNKASLGAHMRNCKSNPKNNDGELGNLILSSDTEAIQPFVLNETIVTQSSGVEPTLIELLNTDASNVEKKKKHKSKKL